MSRYKIVRRKPHQYASFDVHPSTPTTITDTGTQTYTIPSGVDTLTITMYGGGGGGGLADAGRGGTTKGGGGGGGSRLVFTLNEVRGGQVLTFNVGAGGAKSASTSLCSTAGGNTTLTHDGCDFIAGGGEQNRSAGLSLGGSCDLGGGGVADCDSCADCTATNGNDGTAYNTGSSTTPGGAALGDSAGAGGDGSNNASSQNATNGGDGKVIIS